MAHRKYDEESPRQKADREEELQMADEIEDYGDNEDDSDLYPDLVDAAIKAGEKAAAEDIKKDADKLLKENARLSKELQEAQEVANSASAKVKEATDRSARVQADWENFRKRTAAERLEEKKRATENLIEKLLPSIDDLERAIEHTQNAQTLAEHTEGDQKNSAGTNGNNSVAELAAGVSAVHDKILDVLKSEGVEVIDSVGTPFDPTREQAVGNVEDASLPEESVAEVLRKGYAVSGKVIRPAMVSVSHGGPSQKKSEEETK